jgi:hypothetical protein
MLAARRAAEESVSRGPRLEVDVSSRMRSGNSAENLPELVLDTSIKSADRPDAGRVPGKGAAS